MSPTGSDVANDCRTEATPCRTIAYAATQAAPNQTLWFADATFTDVDQTTVATVAAGLRVRARTPGSAIVTVRLTLLGGNRVEGLVIDGGAGAAGDPGISVSTGAVTFEGVALRGRLRTPLRIGGDAVVTMVPGALTNYAAGVLADSDTNGYSPFCEVADDAQLTITGGTFEGEGAGQGVGHGAQLPNPYGAVFAARNNARLVMDGVTLKVRSRGVAVWENAAFVLRNSTIGAVAMNAVGYGVWVSTGVGSTSIEIEASTISGFAYASQSAGIALPDYQGPSQATVTVTDSTLSGNSLGVLVHSTATAQMTFSNVNITNNLFGGLDCPGTCALDMTGGTVTGNAGYSAQTGFSYYGGLSFAAPDRAYDVKLRNVTITGNRNTVNNGNTNVDGNSGVTLAGNAASVFDLGTGVSPGGNVLTGNDTGNVTTNLNVKVTAGVTVPAVGNTFDVSLQGASAAGLYQLGAAPCSSTDCNLTAGTGANYRVTGGTLRLAE